MGAACSRCRRVSHADLDEWLVVDHEPARPNRLIKMIKQTTRKLTVLLATRQVWSKLGRWLQTPGSQKHPKRALLAQTWGQLGKTVRGHSELFKHLDRKGGKLEFKKLE